MTTRFFGVWLIAAILVWSAAASAQDFFNNINNGDNDPTPQAPIITPFDLQLLVVCGGWGHQHPGQKRNFRLLLDRPEFKPEMTTIFGQDPTPAQKDALTQWWFEVGGFVHVFCGEPKPGGNLGGLHFHARYIQGQKQQWLKQIKPLEITPNQVYTMWLEYQDPKSGAWLKSRNPKGYGWDLSGADLLGLGYRILQKPPGNPRIDANCLAPSPAHITKPYKLVVWVNRNRQTGKRGIGTLYPDKTPKGKDCPSG